MDKDFLSGLSNNDMDDANHLNLDLSNSYHNLNSEDFNLNNPVVAEALAAAIEDISVEEE